MARHKKRRHAELDDAERENTTGVVNFGLGGTLSSLKRESVVSSNNEAIALKNDTRDTGGDWEVVDRQSKRSKKSSAEKDNYPSITHSSHARLQTQVRISDLQVLILYLLADGPSPQWVSIRHHKAIRKVVALMVPGLEREMFSSSMLGDQVETLSGSVSVTPDEADYHGLATRKLVSPDDYYPQPLVKDDLPSPLQPMADIFKHLWPIKSPGDDRLKRMHSPLQAILSAPLPKGEDERQTKGPRPPREGKDWKDSPTAITDFLANVDQLREFEFVVHPVLLESTLEREVEAQKRLDMHQTTLDGWVDTVVSSMEECSNSIDENSKNSILTGKTVVAIDCEMCMTDVETFELTRVSLINWDGLVLMDELVKPEKPITDYLTLYSGITKEKLDPITTTLKDIQKRLLDILTPQTILVGHSLNSDLNALKMTHHSIVDSSMLYPHPRGPPFRSSLKWLAQKYLSRDIQGNSNGHDSVEDAKAALSLVKLKCQRGPQWGTPEAHGESIFKRISRSTKPQASASSSNTCISAIVDWGSPKRGYGGAADICIGCTNDGDVVAGVKRAVLGDDDGKMVPGGGVEFVWARMRELEAIRGWWGSSKTLDNEIIRESATKAAGNDGNGVADADHGSNSASSAIHLAAAVARTVTRIKEIYDSLPPCTAFILYSGSGDPRELSRFASMQEQFKKEYKVKKWDQLSVRWTDTEEEGMRAACQTARQGIGFVTVK